MKLLATALDGSDQIGLLKDRQMLADRLPRSRLSDGPALKSEIEEEAEAQDISVKGALKRAKIKLGVRTFKEKGKLDGKWLWALPTNRDSESES